MQPCPITLPRNWFFPRLFHLFFPPFLKLVSQPLLLIMPRVHPDIPSIHLVSYNQLPQPQCLQMHAVIRQGRLQLLFTPKSQDSCSLAGRAAWIRQHRIEQGESYMSLLSCIVTDQHAEACQGTTGTLALPSGPRSIQPNSSQSLMLHGKAKSSCCNWPSVQHPPPPGAAEA